MKKIKVFFKKKNYLINIDELEKQDFDQLISTLCMISPISILEKQKLIETTTSEEKIKLFENIINFSLADEDNTILELSIKKLDKYKKCMDNFELDRAIKEIIELLSRINIYIDKQAPWLLKKTDIKRMNVVLSVSIELIKRSTLMLLPIIPNSSIKVFNLLNINYLDLNFQNISILPDKEQIINRPEVLFPRIEVND